MKIKKTTDLKTDVTFSFREFWFFVSTHSVTTFKPVLPIEILALSIELSFSLPFGALPSVFTLFSLFVFLKSLRSFKKFISMLPTISVLLFLT